MIRKLAINNTYNFGRVTFLILKEKKLYTGVCLEFDLVVQAPTPEETKEHIEDLASAWLKNVIKNRLPEKLLNKSAPKKYWAIAKEIENKVETKRGQLAITRLAQKPDKPSVLYFSIVQNYLGYGAFGK
ncbi:MAG: hypothetical protein UT84_C0017G0014 [Candidatus Curtissbacteria bacterium GW2011_GWA1_40_16]|uniref:Uncharacterized protein n=1 Tax=Candidatus Curtissbacteria bacterium GW2011_GWA1_40_16 TaxID=1618405 RepID=A0A0G0RJ70_9BACT|nr:MAG: hypothetical protein UT84_C0017G0014 [Candidatus Curtissbacteria bacterium GW2011_GWA1_40_16]